MRLLAFLRPPDEAARRPGHDERAASAYLYPVARRNVRALPIERPRVDDATAAVAPGAGTSRERT
jgi:hypothetical protein